MAFAFNWEEKEKATAVFVRVDGVTQIYSVGTDDVEEARQEVVRMLGLGFRKHGAVLAKVK